MHLKLTEIFVDVTFSLKFAVVLLFGVQCGFVMMYKQLKGNGARRALGLRRFGDATISGMVRNVECGYIMCVGVRDMHETFGVWDNIRIGLQRYKGDGISLRGCGEDCS